MLSVYVKVLCMMRADLRDSVCTENLDIYDTQWPACSSIVTTDVVPAAPRPSRFGAFS